MNPFYQVMARNKGKGLFKFEASADAATVYLYDAIVNTADEAAYFGGVDPKSFIDAIKAIDAPVINLRINCPGGSVFAGRAMEQALREHPSKVIAHVDGYSASAASFLMMAADEIVMASGAMVMIHNAWSMAFGNASELRQTADLLEKIDGTLISTYAARTLQDPKQIQDWMAAETWFTATEAVAAGFADKVAETKAKAQWDMSAYAKAVAIEPEPEPIPEPQFDTSALLRKLEVVARI
jgi:ATP-dependent Clp protease protease subunit